MHARPLIRCGSLAALLFAVAIVSSAADSTNTFTVATYNVENWLSMERGSQTNAPKPVAARDAVALVLGTVRPDVLGVVEVGQPADLADLQTRLRAQGLEFPHTEWITGADTTRHVALLSRFPITQRLSATHCTYPLDGKPRRIERGILDVRVHVHDRYSFRALVVHLKSHRETEDGNQAEMRLGEARLLRQHLDAILQADPNANFLAMGDFNDTPDAEPIRVAIGAGPFQLFALPARDAKGYETTHFWRAKRHWSRLDYLMASPGMSNEYVTGTATIADPPELLKASDHRPVFANFHDRDIGPAPKPPLTQHPALAPILIVVLVIIVAGIVIFFITAQRQPRP